MRQQFKRQFGHATPIAAFSRFRIAASFCFVLWFLDFSDEDASGADSDFDFWEVCADCGEGFAGCAVEAGAVSGADEDVA
ncbi:MAG TPA: hypothetical protein VNQ78_13045, partial [Paracoccus sp. (in: a-proteobacteria)]|uniref:hypothetical protein n=1 Tax=Paracoccus sp. TaxID=267 RepID=UPI002CC38B1E